MQELPMQTYTLRKVEYVSVEADPQNLITYTQAVEMLGLEGKGALSALRSLVRERDLSIYTDDANPHPFKGKNLLLRHEIEALARARAFC
jgi:hypothetical protein